MKSISFRGWINATDRTGSPKNNNDVRLTVPVSPITITSSTSTDGTHSAAVEIERECEGFSPMVSSASPTVESNYVFGQEISIDSEIEESEYLAKININTEDNSLRHSETLLLPQSLNPGNTARQPNISKPRKLRRHSRPGRPLSMRQKFDPSAAQERLEKMWSLNAEFGRESDPYCVYLDQMVSDRYVLLNGMQVLRDELHIAFNEADPTNTPEEPFFDYVCHADFNLPSVVSTIAHTNCGDRVAIAANQVYESMVASRFSSISELGDIKPERFNPTGGGTDDGRTLAHVTVAHQMDPPLRRRIYAGHPQSFILVNFDLKTHCGKITMSSDDMITDAEERFTGIRCFYGKCRESQWREARNACGAIVGCIRSFDPLNAIHIRLRNDLGEESFKYLQENQILANDGTPVTYLVAAAIIAIRGMISTARALANELDERGVGSLTASIIINSSASANIGIPDNVLYLGRCTVFQKQIRVQSLGTEARLYTATIEDGNVLLTYNKIPSDDIPIQIIQP